MIVAVAKVECCHLVVEWHLFVDCQAVAIFFQIGVDVLHQPQTLLVCSRHYTLVELAGKENLLRNHRRIIVEGGNLFCFTLKLFEGTHKGFVFVHQVHTIQNVCITTHIAIIHHLLHLGVGVEVVNPFEGITVGECCAVADVVVPRLHLVEIEGFGEGHSLAFVGVNFGLEEVLQPVEVFL